MKTFKCSTCKRRLGRTSFYELSSPRPHRDVTYECRSCKRGRKRAADSYRRALRRHGSVCDWCLWPKPLTPAGSCRQCLGAAGGRHCPRCDEVLPAASFGSESDTVCRACVGELFAFALEEQLPATATERAVVEGASATEVALRHRYGVLPEQYEALLAAQGGGCAICRRGPTGGRWLSVDDTAAGEARLLCAGCAGGLRLLGRSPELLRAALDYLSER